MPVDYTITDTQSCTLEEALEGFAQIPFEPRDEAATAQIAHWLKRLLNNRDFLADILIERLKGGGDDIASGYGPQAIVLSPLRAGSFVRANIWPAASDLVLRDSGSKTFAYGVPHDHNFAFLTGGYCGPGYVSDHYEYDYSAACGYRGEEVPLRFTGRSTLGEGAIQFYRPHHDIHCQHPPQSLSVSLNVIHVDPSQAWFDQYRFDLERGQIAGLLNSNATEILLRTAVASGSEAAQDFAAWIGKTHPRERLRLASFEARAARLDEGARDALWREGELCGSRMVAKAAQTKRSSPLGRG